MIVTSSSSSSSTTPHRVVNQQGYDGMMSKGGQYQPGMPLSVVPSGGPGQYQGNMPQGTLIKKNQKAQPVTINIRDIYPICNRKVCFCASRSLSPWSGIPWLWPAHGPVFIWESAPVQPPFLPHLRPSAGTPLHKPTVPQQPGHDP